MLIVGVLLLASGPAGKVIEGGMMAMAGWTLAQAVTVISGEFVEEVLRVIMPWALVIGTLAVTINSNSLPGLVSLSWVVNDLLFDSAFCSFKGSSRLLVMRTTVEAPGASAGIFRTAKAGFTSTGFQ